MGTAFVSMSIVMASLVVGLRRTLGSRVSRVGIGCLAWFGVAVWIALAFPLDPIGSEVTTPGIIHRINGATSFLAATVGVMLVSRSLRHIGSWEQLGRRAQAIGYGMVALYVVTLVTNVAKLGIAGLVQRLDLILFVSWATMVAMRLRRDDQPEIAAP